MSRTASANTALPDRLGHDVEGLHGRNTRLTAATTGSRRTELSAALCTRGPKIGGRILKPSHIRAAVLGVDPPAESEDRATITTMTTISTSQLIRTFEILIRIWVGSGSWPPRLANSFLKIGTISVIMTMKMTPDDRDHHDRVGHGAADLAVQLDLLLQLGSDALEHLVDRTADLARPGPSRRRGCRTPWGAWPRPVTARTRPPRRSGPLGAWPRSTCSRPGSTGRPGNG